MSKPTHPAGGAHKGAGKPDHDPDPEGAPDKGDAAAGGTGDGKPGPDKGTGAAPDAGEQRDTAINPETGATGTPAQPMPARPPKDLRGNDPNRQAYT